MSRWTLSELAQAVGAQAHGDDTVLILGVCGVDSPVQAGRIAMAETSEHLAALRGGAVAAILHGPELVLDAPGLIHPEPRLVFAKLLELFHPRLQGQPGVHATAIVDSRATVDPSAHIGPHCLIGPRANIGAHCFLQSFVSVGEDATIGEGCQLYAHVMVGQESELAPDCCLEPWAQVGNNVRLGAGVDLGAHTALGHGVQVGPGAKFDNLVVVGPRSRIGEKSLLVGQSSVDRDAHLHAGVILAGQSAVGPEAELVSGVQLGGRSWALGKLDKPGPYLGNPARPLKEEMRRQALERKAKQGS